MFNPLANPKSSHKVYVHHSIVVFTVMFLLGLLFLFYVRWVLVMLFLSVIIMSALNPGVNKLEKYLRLPRTIGMLIMYSIVLLLLISSLIVVVPPLVSELGNLTKSFDLLPLQEELKNFKLTISDVNRLMQNIGNSVNFLRGIVTSTFSGIFTVMTIIVMSFYLLIDRKNLHKKLYWFTSEEKTIKKAEKFIDNVEHQLGGWVRGQIILMIVIGLVTYVGLILMGVPYALPLAILAGLLEILPNIGPTIAAIPSIILAYAAGGFIPGIATTFFYLIVQQLENNLLVPKVMKDSVDVNPLITILSMLTGATLAGIVGAILAVPTYIILRTFYSMWLRKK